MSALRKPFASGEMRSALESLNFPARGFFLTRKSVNVIQRKVLAADVAAKRIVAPFEDVAAFAKLSPASGTSSGRLDSADLQRERCRIRLRMLRQLPADHDGEGASAANATSVDFAIAFLDDHHFDAQPIATLDDDGLAVFEMRGFRDGAFADMTFNVDGTISIYLREPGNPSEEWSIDPTVDGALDMFDRIGVLPL